MDHIAGCFIIRDTKNPMQPGLVFSRAEYTAFRRRITGDSRARSVVQYATFLLHSMALILRNVFH